MANAFERVVGGSLAERYKNPPPAAGSPPESRGTVSFKTPITSYEQAEKFAEAFPENILDIFKQIQGTSAPAPLEVPREALVITHKFTALSERAKKGENVDLEKEALAKEIDDLRGAIDASCEYCKQNPLHAPKIDLNRQIETEAQARYFVENVEKEVHVQLSLAIKQGNFKPDKLAILYQYFANFKEAVQKYRDDGKASFFIIRVDSNRAGLQNWVARATTPAFSSTPSRISKIWFTKTLFFVAAATIALTGYVIKRYFKL